MDGVGDGSPTPKWVDTFRTIHGQAPEAPHRQGSYYAPSVAYHGLMNDLHPDAPGHQNIGNFTLALGSPLPTIDVPVGARTVSFAPFAKSVDGCYVKPERYVPTVAEALESPLWYAAKWGGFDDRNGDGLPQTEEWDSDGDGAPDNYFPVTDPSRMVDTLRGVFERISAANASATVVGVSGGSITGGSHVYETSFRSVDWTGELRSRPITASGEISSTPDWDADRRLAARLDRRDDREILTWKPSTRTGIPFRWPRDAAAPQTGELDAEQVRLLSVSPVDDAPDDRGERRLDWLRGDTVAGFRTRVRPLGDIVHSSPQLVGPPVYRYRDDWGDGAPENGSPYADFSRRHAARDRVVYVGANDGMLHAFDAGSADDPGTGRELFAYVPGHVYPELPELPAADYAHRYYVDATPRTADVFIGGRWRTVLVGALGKGGQGIYALDVTDPAAIGEGTAERTVLWEYGDADDPDVGYSFQSPLIVRTHAGRWAAIFTNGYNNGEPDGRRSTHRRSAVFVVDIETGRLIRKMQTEWSPSDTTSGMGEPTAVDLDNDDIVDVVYAGDLTGRLWKFGISATDPRRWGRVGDELFVTDGAIGERVPFTTRPAVGRHPTGSGVIVYAATGKYLEPSDQLLRTRTNKVYAIWDRDPFDGRRVRSSELLEQGILREVRRDHDSDGDGVDDMSAEVRESTERPIDWSLHSGWYLELGFGTSAGERVIAAPLLRENRLVLSTQVPRGDECSPEQGGWLMLFDAASGAMPRTGIDLDGDGLFSERERLAGVRGLLNPMSAPAVVTGVPDDVLLTSHADGSGIGSITLDACTPVGRVSWRELEP